MKSSEFIPDTYCGLYCASCPMYMETESGKQQEQGLPGCNGCKSSNVAQWCRECDIKKCARDKKLDNCSECDSYPCDVLETFKCDKKMTYHSEIYDSLLILKEEGKLSWLNKMENRWKCTSCNSRFNWWQQKCSNCGEAVTGYKEPNWD